MFDSIDKGMPLMTPTFFDDNDPNNPKRKTYIECKAVLKIIYDIKENKEIPKNYGTLLDIIRSIRNLPTADVVEVVRCKDCEHLKRNSLYAWCEPKSTIWDKYIVQPDNFCCWGKRKGS